MTRRIPCFLLAAVLLFAAPASRAADAPDPLRLVPDTANLVFKVARPRAVAELVVSLASQPELAGFRGYRDTYESTNYRLFTQLLASIERELEKKWPELLDRLAGGGVVVSLHGKEMNQPLLVIQGTDAKLLGTVRDFAIKLVEQELARQGSKAVYGYEKHRDVTVVTLGKDLNFAVLDAALVLSSDRKLLEMAIDQHLDASKPSVLKSPAFVSGSKLLPEGALAWLWFNLKVFRDNPESEAVIGLPSSFFPFQIVAGGLIDAVRRGECLTLAAHQETGAITLSMRIPAGRDGRHEIAKAHGPAAGERGALPLLTPERALFSHSYYLDLHHFWANRDKLLPADQLAAAEAFDKESSKFLAGNKFSEVLAMLGARQRVVIASQGDPQYKTLPANQLPAFGLVLELRKPKEFDEFTGLATAAASFLGGFQVKHTRREETHNGVKLMTYQFAENDKNKEFGDGVLFNFTPCHAKVGDQFIIASTTELGRQLIDEVKRDGDRPKSDAVVASRLSWGGLAAHLRLFEKGFITANMLEQGNTREEAVKEVQLYLELVKRLGNLELKTSSEADRYQFDVKFSTDSKK